MRLFVFCGFPGVGKTTLAKKLVTDIKATYLRIDSIEQAIAKSSAQISEIADAGYQAGYSLATDNLKSGRLVVVDGVNPLNEIRDLWRELASKCNAGFTIIEVICSDKSEHHARVNSRRPDIKGHQLPTWHEVIGRYYEDWEQDRIVIDTAGKNEEQSFGDLKALL